MDSEMPPSSTANEPAPAGSIPLWEIFRLFLVAGAVSFGGGVVAYQREFLVRDRKWLTDEDFLSALEISETLPGLNSMNIAVIVGDNLRKIPGVIAAVLGLMIPGTAVMMTLGVLWEESRHNPNVTSFLLGIAAAAVGLLFVVTTQMGRNQLTRLPDAMMIVLTFVAVSLFRISLLWVLLVLGAVSIFLYRPGSQEAKRPAPSEHLHLPFHRGAHHGKLRR
jgi:chromate transporter